jgi:hypothetical protein
VLSGPPVPRNRNPPRRDLVEYSFLQNRARGSGGDDERHSERLHLWLYPLPPAVECQLVYEWPAAGIRESRTSLEGAAIADAGRRGRAFWQE